MVRLQGRDHGEPLREGRVVPGGREEGVPVAPPAREVVQPVPDVGEDPVDVDDRDRPRGALGRAHPDA